MEIRGRIVVIANRLIKRFPGAECVGWLSNNNQLQRPIMSVLNPGLFAFLESIVGNISISFISCFIHDSPNYKSSKKAVFAGNTFTSQAQHSCTVKEKGQK